MLWACLKPNVYFSPVRLCFVLFIFASLFASLFAGRWSLFAASLSFGLSCLSYWFSYNGSIGGRLSPQPIPLPVYVFVFVL